MTEFQKAASANSDDRVGAVHRRKRRAFGGACTHRIGWCFRVGQLSSREADRLMGATQGHSHAVACGRITDPHVSTVTALAKLFGVSLDWLVSGVGDTPAESAIREAIAAARERHIDAPDAKPVKRIATQKRWSRRLPRDPNDTTSAPTKGAP